MRTKFIATGSAKGSARDSIDLPIGRYGALMLVIKGTTDTAQTLAAADIGRIRLQRGGREICNETWDFFYTYSDLKTGWPHATLPAAGATRLSLLVPFNIAGIPNSLDVMSKEECDLFLDFDGTLDTRFGANACTYEVYGILQPTQPEVYELHVEEQDFTLSAAGRVNDKLSGRNVGAIYFSDPGADVSAVSFAIDGDQIINNVDDAALLDITNMMNRKEATGNTFVEITQVVTGAIQEVANTNVEIEITFSGAGTLYLTKFRAEPSARAAQSRQNVAAYLQSKAANISGGIPSRPPGAVS